MQIKLKNQAVDLTDLALGIIVLGVVVSVGATILINVRDSRLTDLSTVRTINETTFINSSADTFSNTWVKSLDACINGTGGEVIQSGNWTFSISSANGVGTLSNATAANWPAANCTYTWYNTSGAQWDLPNKAAVGIGEYGNWFKIIVIVGVAAVVLSLIFMSFGRKEGSGIGGTY